MNVLFISILNVLTDVASETPQWVEQIMQMWGQASGWIKALAIGLGLTPALLVGILSKLLLTRNKSQETNREVGVLKKDVKDFGNILEKVVLLLNDKLGENANEIKNALRLSKENIDNNTEILELLVLIIGLTNAPLTIKEKALEIAKKTSGDNSKVAKVINAKLEIEKEDLASGVSNQVQEILK